MKDDITIDGTNAALSQQEEDISTATKLYRTQDAATLAGIQSPQLRNARKRFMKLADRLNLKPADETADALIDSELADIFARIDKITDADKLRRIQAHISERLAEIDGKKNKLANARKPLTKKL